MMIHYLRQQVAKWKKDFSLQESMMYLLALRKLLRCFLRRPWQGGSCLFQEDRREGHPLVPAGKERKIEGEREASRGKKRWWQQSNGEKEREKKMSTKVLMEMEMEGKASQGKERQGHFRIAYGLNKSLLFFLHK